MLYDPKWEKQTKADPWSIGSLVAWLERKPPHQIYCYVDNGHCLIAQYLKFLGYRKIRVGAGGRYTADCIGDVAPNSFFLAARGQPRTFGAALERARNDV